MLRIKFKNLDRSELAREAVLERMEAMTRKFEDLRQSRITVTLEMENSPTQAGPDRFRVKLFIAGGRFEGLTISKSDANLYKALAELTDHMLESLNRVGRKGRVRERANARKFAQYVPEKRLVEELVD